eukprot:TRINITY_DN547_c0_g1_i1.p1 TRINITY_DN547_c0_g1~~TRINITY_DN547_c0_g1_i1.p1  ORF type:complete len:673 (+),score=192.35 TRINITY_DN547_c0_g1_i1:285-2303(+)
MTTTTSSGSSNNSNNSNNTMPPSSLDDIPDLEELLLHSIDQLISLFPTPPLNRSPSPFPGGGPSRNTSTQSGTFTSGSFSSCSSSSSTSCTSQTSSGSIFTSQRSHSGSVDHTGSPSGGDGTTPRGGGSGHLSAVRHKLPKAPTPELTFQQSPSSSSPRSPSSSSSSPGYVRNSSPSSLNSSSPSANNSSGTTSTGEFALSPAVVRMSNSNDELSRHRSIKFTKTAFDYGRLLKGVRRELDPKEQEQLIKSLLSLPEEQVVANLAQAYTHLEKHPARARGRAASKSDRLTKTLSQGVLNNMSLLTGNRKGKKTKDKDSKATKKGSGKMKRGHGTTAQKPVKQSSEECIGVDPVKVWVSSTHLHFQLQGKLCPVNSKVSDLITITCTSGPRAKFQFGAMPKVSGYDLTITPDQGIIKKGQSDTIRVHLTFHTTTVVRRVFWMDVEELGRYFFVVDIESEKSEFGVDMKEIEFDIDPDYGLQVPKILVTMKKHFVANKGLMAKDVFRASGNEFDTMTIKRQLSYATFKSLESVHADSGNNLQQGSTPSVHCLATLIKVWFRELPTQLLSGVRDRLETIDSADECDRIFAEIREPNKSLMAWLLSLLAEVAHHQQENNMTPKDLATNIAPNLLNSVLGDVSGATMGAEAMSLSRKTTNFVHQLLLATIRKKYESR